MLRINKLTDYAVEILCLMAIDKLHVYSAIELAETSHNTLATVSKILKILAKAGLLDSVRGAQGGYKLKRQARDISVAEVIQIMEGSFALTECSLHTGNCTLEKHCSSKHGWKIINAKISQLLESTSIAKMVVSQHIEL